MAINDPALDEPKHGWDFPADLPEAAWGIIANAWHGNWDDAPPEWRDAAIRWRDAYHAYLDPTRQRRPQPDHDDPAVHHLVDGSCHHADCP